MAAKNKKEVKLQGKFRVGKSPVMGKRWEKEVPWLNVSGVWLEELGFKVGETVNITTSNRLLIIEPLERATVESGAGG